VVQMYKVVNKCTGSLGGNGSGGAIYGGASAYLLRHMCGIHHSSVVISFPFLSFRCCRVDQVVDAKGDRASSQESGLGP
jgi:hypothetical protein